MAGREKEEEERVFIDTKGAKKWRDEAAAHMNSCYYERALICLNKAFDLAPDEKATLVARSKCLLLLGDPPSALADAEAALKLDPKDAKALLRKAEALYYCSEFELSLVHFHRGLKARPDLSDFRLGVQKAQEAIEITIGNQTKDKETELETPNKKGRPKSAKPFLGKLNHDKMYLENLLRNPDVAIADKKNDVIVKQAEEGIKFLETREEFWRQRKTVGDITEELAYKTM